MQFVMVSKVLYSAAQSLLNLHRTLACGDAKSVPATAQRKQERERSVKEDVEVKHSV